MGSELWGDAIDVVELVGGWIGEWVGGWIGEWVGGWVGGWVGRWVGGAVVIMSREGTLRG